MRLLNDQKVNCITIECTVHEFVSKMTNFSKHSSEVESRTQGSRPRPRIPKKSEAKAKDGLSEDRTSRSQGQECSMPRTKDTGASVLQKKFFQAISNSLAYPEFLVGLGLNHKSLEMTSSKFSKEEVFVGQRYRRMKDLKSLLAVCT